MTQQHTNSDEFYVGYNPQTPKGIKRFLSWRLILLLVAVVGLSVVLVASQQGFSTGTFELGKATEVEGYLVNDPVPMLKVNFGKDVYGNPLYKTIPLLNYGKFGAESAITDWASAQSETMESMMGSLVKITGTFIYHDGVSLLELTKKGKSIELIEKGALPQELTPKAKDLGAVALQGEIVDPKCYFGVMKPGYSKVHRACAIRCISGGIPPVMVVRNLDGEALYYLLRGPKGEDIHEKLLPYVADPIAIKGRLKLMDDWLILQVNPETIERIPNG